MSLRDILKALQRREIDVEEAEKRIKILTIDEIEGIVKLDVGREQRRKIPEVILAEYKDTKTLLQIIKRKISDTDKVILSRVKEEQFEEIMKMKKDYNIISSSNKRIVVIKKNMKEKKVGKVGIVAAGTSDIPLAEEVKILTEEFGCNTKLIVDSGISGIHRTFSAAKKMIQEDVDVVVAIAGMEGILPIILSTLMDIPVIGLPASIGYGLGGNGITALLTMLQTCTPGLTVVNIDNSVGAAAAAALIARRRK